MATEPMMPPSRFRIEVISPMIDKDAQPTDLGDAVPLAAVNKLREAVDEAV